MEDNKVTIIVGVYNSADFLKKGLDSLINQTWKNIEVIMMDDGSTDNSGYICDEYSRVDERFKVVHKANSGVCDSRNKGLELATGDYVCFMDGDDWFSKDFVEYMMYIIKDTKTEMAFSDKIFTTRDQTQSKDEHIQIWNSEKAISLIIYPYMVIGPWNKIYSMKIIRENNIKFPPHWFGETLHFASTVAYYSEKVGVAHRKVYNYRLNNSNSGTTQFSVESRLLSLENATELRNKVFAQNPQIQHAIEWHIYANYFNLIINIIGSRNEVKYKKELQDAKNYLQKNWFDILKYSDVNIKEKIKIFMWAFFPYLYAKRIVKKQIHGLENDTMA